MRRWHRLFGAGLSVFVIFMVLSGLAINHSNGLGFDKRYVSQALLLEWYGLGAPEDIDSFAVENDWLSFAGSQLYLNGIFVATISRGVGAVANGDMLITAGSEELLLLDRQGSLIERIPWGHPGTGPIELIGVTDGNRVVVRSLDQLWMADSEFLSWQRVSGDGESPVWSSSQAAPSAIHETITRHYRGDGLSLERLLLDFHSGRAFGKMGIFVYDLLALAVGFLAISGLIFWWRGRRNGNGNGNGNGNRKNTDT